MKKCSLSLMMLFLLLLSHAQEQLNIEQAIEISLKNNYSILIAKNQEEIAKNDVSRGHAGMLPHVGLNASRNFSSANTKQEYSNGTMLDKTGASSNNLAAGVALSWTIFDGLKMFATYEKLKELIALGEINSKIQIENKVEQIIVAYFDIVRQLQMYIASDSTMALYAERAKIAEQKWKIGTGSKSDFLQAQVDINEQKSIQLKQRTAISSRKIILNQLLGRKADIKFSVISEIDIHTGLKLEEATSAAIKKNNSILFYNRNISVSEFALKEIRAQRMPSITLNSAYNFSRTENQAGFFLLNQNLGLNAGITANWTLFNGLNVQRQIKNSEITLLNSKLYLENVKAQVESEILIAYENYQTALETLELEELNSGLAKENSQIMLDRYRLGNAMSLDIKTAQKSYFDALSRLIQARYDAKVAETALLRLKGELVK